MAATRIYTAGLQAVSNQVILSTGVPTTEGSARPCVLTAVQIKCNKAQSGGGYLKLWNLALSTDVNADHITTEPWIILPFTTQAISGKQVQKYSFPQGLDFNLGMQVAMDTTIVGNTAVATTVLPEEVMIFWTEK